MKFKINDKIIANDGDIGVIIDVFDKNLQKAYRIKWDSYPQSCIENVKFIDSCCRIAPEEEIKNISLDALNEFREEMRKPQPARELILPQGAEWQPDAQHKPSCTCGISAIGGGLHSDYCDLYEGPNGD